MLSAWKPRVLAALALALVAAPAQAGSDMPVPLGLTVHFAPCPGLPDAPGCSDVNAAEVYVRERADRWTLAHEVGHVYLEGLGPYWKGALVDRLGFRPGSAWDRGSGEDCFGRACPSELAADLYAGCALGLDPRPRRVRLHGEWAITNPRGWESAYGYEPTRRHHRRLCDVLRRSALDPGRR